MIDIEEIEKYLPYYLTAQDKRSLLEEINRFPDNINQRLFTNYLKGEKNIFQGDGFKGLLFVNFPDEKIGKKPAMVISNTCDVDINNKRLIPKRVVYAPIFKLESYEKMLTSTQVGENGQPLESIRSHIDAIRKQHLSDIFYLPKCDSLPNESIVFLDRLNNSSIESFCLDNLNEERLFTLSDYGFYLLVIKLSIHFSRVKENVKRSFLQSASLV